MRLVKKHTAPLLEDCFLLREREFDIATIRIYSNAIFHVYFYSGGNLNMSFIQQVYDFVDEGGGGIYCNLFEFEPNVDIEPEVRAWASSPTGNKNTIADALLISSLPHKLIANFYVKFNKPVKPTKIFNSREKAVQWLLKQNSLK